MIILCPKEVEYSPSVQLNIGSQAALNAAKIEIF
jgi:hypothetical protein